MVRWRFGLENKTIIRVSFVSSLPLVLSNIPEILLTFTSFTNKEKALSTAHRVLKKGGVFSCLEFSKVDNFVLDQIYRRYSFSVIPMMGQLIAGDRDSYQYLVESIVKVYTLSLSSHDHVLIQLLI